MYARVTVNEPSVSLYIYDLEVQSNIDIRGLSALLLVCVFRSLVRSLPAPLSPLGFRRMLRVERMGHGVVCWK